MEARDALQIIKAVRLKSSELSKADIEAIGVVEYKINRKELIGFVEGSKLMNTYRRLYK